uniref:Nucleotide kinase n=1 Tax=Heligmosomoides polygyrus TaxID=6339 RepID=A0A183FA74_HELPZ
LVILPTPATKDMTKKSMFRDGFDLEKIDAEIKIEKIRQTASKLSWDGFQQALRRNLMEKRFIFDTEGRIDLLQAISTIRRNLPGRFLFVDVISLDAK